MVRASAARAGGGRERVGPGDTVTGSQPSNRSGNLSVAGLNAVDRVLCPGRKPGSRRRYVEQFVSGNASGIVLAPLDDTALLKPVQSAMAKGIPVVIIDSALNGTPGKDFVSFIATNNHKGGVLGGERLAQLLVNKGKVVLL